MPFARPWIALGSETPRIQRYGASGNNEVLISLDSRETSEQALDQGKNPIISALQSQRRARQEGPKQRRLQHVGPTTCWKTTRCTLGTDAASAMANWRGPSSTYRDKTRGRRPEVALRRGLMLSRPRLLPALQQGFFTSNFGVRNVEIVGPQVGNQLQKQALLATLYSLAGMLVYLWFRFELIYGVAAVVACFHDTLITVGAFSLLNTGNFADRDRRHPHPGRLLDERHHRRLRPHSREYQAVAPRNACPISSTAASTRR